MIGYSAIPTRLPDCGVYHSGLEGLMYSKIIEPAMPFNFDFGLSLRFLAAAP